MYVHEMPKGKRKTALADEHNKHFIFPSKPPELAITSLSGGHCSAAIL